MPAFIRRTSAAAILPLRHAVLRPGLPVKAAVYGPDDAPETGHFGAYDDSGRLVGCVTVHLDPLDGQPAWRLRGMAVDDAARKGGVGRLLVAAVDDFVLAAGDGPKRLWCNARLTAVGFYEKCGWRPVSGVYDIPGVGAHVKMARTGCGFDPTP